MDVSCTYTPGSLSLLLDVESKSDIKKTKLQELFSKPQQLLFIQKIADLPSASSENAVSNKGIGSKSLVDDKERVLKPGRSKPSELNPVFIREESLRNAEPATSRRQQKKLLHLQKVLSEKSETPPAQTISVVPQLVAKVPEKSLHEINAENALKRIERSDPSLRRDTSQDHRTVFVGNVPLTVQKKAILRMFKTCGKVETVRLRSAPVADLKLSKKASIITQQFHPSRNTANFYVVYESPEDAEKALSLNGSELEGFHIRVDLAVVKKHDNQKSIFIGNIPFDGDEESLREHFSECGEITNVRIIRDKTTGVGKGFGYITFEDSSSVSLAVSKNNQTYNGRQLRVQRSKPNTTDKPKTLKNSAARGANKSGNRPGSAKPKKDEQGVQRSSAEKRQQRLDARANHKKHKEVRKKKIRKRAVEKKKESIGLLMTKQRKN